MKEIIMLFQFDDKGRKSKLMRALLPLRIKIKEVPNKDYGKPMGYLAGVKEYVQEDENGSLQEVGTHQEEMVNEVYARLSGEMLVMAGLTGNRVDQVLGAIRKAGLSIPYKAVLTPSNQAWDAWKLFAEIKEEHETMA